MQNTERKTIAVLVDNVAGVLSQVTRLFSRKGFNIESLAVGVTNDPKISRITIEILCDDERLNLLCNQLRKLFSVHSVKVLTRPALRRELVLIKVAAADSEVRNEVMQMAAIFRGNIIDVSPTTLTVSLIGEDDKIESMLALMRQHGILELVRTGLIAIERGTSTIDEKTKELGEFNYGKNVR